MKRVRIFVSVGILLILLFGWWYSQHEWLTDSLLAQIKLGMTTDQVEALLGKAEIGYTLADRGGTLTPHIYPQVSLSAPNNPWLPTCKASGHSIRIEGTRDEPCTTLIWVGRERALILDQNSNGVCSIDVFPITKTGGGFFGWLSRKWDEWIQ
jgi:hypothetical protein